MRQLDMFFARVFGVGLRLWAILPRSLTSRRAPVQPLDSAEMTSSLIDRLEKHVSDNVRALRRQWVYGAAMLCALLVMGIAMKVFVEGPLVDSMFAAGRTFEDYAAAASAAYFTFVGIAAATWAVWAIWSLAPVLRLDRDEAGLLTRRLALAIKARRLDQDALGLLEHLPQDSLLRVALRGVATAALHA